MTTRKTRWGALLAAPLLVGTLAACDPPPPPPTFHVDATDEVSDAVPGDGVCATDVGSCTLQAAVEEADALGRGEVVLPPGEYAAHAGIDGSQVTVRADTSTDPRAFATVVGGFGILSGGGTLALRSIEVQGIILVDAGTLVADRVAVGGPGNGIAVGSGLLVLRNSLVEGVSLWGRLHATASTIYSSGSGHALWRGEGSSATLGGTAILSSTPGGMPECGSAPSPGEVISLGHNYVADDSCDLEGPGDIVGVADDGALFPSPGSPRIDAIPVGVLGCGDALTSDIRLFPRPTDGDGDGVAACDIGAWER